MPTILTIINDKTGNTVWSGPRDSFIQNNKDGLSVGEATAINDLDDGQSMMLGGGAAPLFKIEAAEELPTTISDMHLFLRYLPRMAPVRLEDDGCIVAGYVCGDRELRVWWDVAGQDCVGWAWATRQRKDGHAWDRHESGPLDSVSELRRLMLWVDQGVS